MVGSWLPARGFYFLFFYDLKVSKRLLMVPVEQRNLHENVMPQSGAKSTPILQPGQTPGKAAGTRFDML